MKKLLAAALLLTAPLTSQASDWEYSVTPYLWLPTISMDSPNFNGNGDGLDVGPTNYLESLDFGLMLDADIRNDEWVILGDLIYLDFGIKNKDITPGPIFNPTSKIDLSASIISLAAGKTIINKDDYFMDAVLGWRRTHVDLETKVNGNTLPLFSPTLTFNDVVIGVNGGYQFADSNWSLPYYADVGAGDSDLTWQAMVGLDYAFEWGKLHMNYRHLDYDFGNVGRIQDLQTTFSGPSIGARFEF